MIAKNDESTIQEWALDDCYVHEHADYPLIKDDKLILYNLARAMSTANLAHLLDEWLNLGGKQYREGFELGLIFRGTHRTLQRCVIALCLGIICGLSRQSHFDARNEHAIQWAQQVYKDVNDGNINIGSYI